MMSHSPNTEGSCMQTVRKEETLAVEFMNETKIKWNLSYDLSIIFL
jgi:hypothetical protein